MSIWCSSKPEESQSTSIIDSFSTNRRSNVQVQPLSSNSTSHTNHSNNVYHNISTFENIRSTPTTDSFSTSRRSYAQVLPLSSNFTCHSNNVHQIISNVKSKYSQNTSIPESFSDSRRYIAQVQSLSSNSTLQNISTVKSWNNQRTQAQVQNKPFSIVYSSYGNIYRFQSKKCYANVSSSTSIISSADFNRFQHILYSAVLNQSRDLNWYGNWYNEYQVIHLQPGTYEYNNILENFSYSILEQRPYVIQILRVENPYLLGQYYLKKLEYQNKGLPIQEIALFHGTKCEYVDNICRNNFDSRLYGQTAGNRFEQGVCFTPKSRYANHYCNKSINERSINDKVMIVVKVLVSRTCKANRVMNIPDYYDENRLLRYDTSVPKKDVLVKYCDDEFYPAYLIHYR